MLTESIGERITEKTSSAKHKIFKDYQSSKNLIENWTEEKKSNTTKRLKNVREKITNATFSLKRKDKSERRSSLDMVSQDRPQTLPPNNDELFQSLSFNSPLNNRTNNSENIPGESATYEIPKSFRLSERTSSESNDLPSYDDVVKDDHCLQRNTVLTQSMYTMVQKNGLKKSVKNKSDTNLNEYSDEAENYEEVFPRPRSPPRIPPPPLPKEGIYGKIKSVPSLNYENAPPIIKRRPPIQHINNIEDVQIRDDISTRANFSDSQIFSRHLSDNCSTFGATNISKQASSTANVSQCESWGNYDGMSTESIVSSLEPIYSNDENERVHNKSTDERLYGNMFEMNTDMLSPQKILNTDTANALRISIAAVSLTRELLTEFDPLSNEKKLEEFMTNNTNHLALLETLLGEETYGSVGDQNLIEDETLFEEDSSVESVSMHPSPPERLDSLDVVVAPSVAVAPKIPPRSSKTPAVRQSQIIHQNLHLRAESYENLDDVSEPFLAKFTAKPKQSNVDLTRPKPAQTNWFVESEPEKFTKNNLDNPLNNKNQQKSQEKVMKTVPILPPKQNNLDNYLPTYEESKNDEIVAETSGNNNIKPEKTKTSIFQSMLNLKRKPSISRQSKSEVAVVVQKDFISRPPFCDDLNLLLDKTVILFKLPSGVLEDILKELNPRFIELKRKQFKAYSDLDFKILKEHIDLTHMSSCQYVVNHKFTDGGRQIYCFEMNLAIPKHSSSSGQSNSSSPSTSNASGKMTSYKTNRVTHVYGIHTKMEK